MSISNIKGLGNYAKDTSIYLCASLIPMILNLLINPLIAINMSPYDYAIFGYFSSFSTLISPIIVFYMLHYYTKSYYELTEKDRIKLKALLFKSLIFFSLIIALISFCLLLLYSSVINRSSEMPNFPYLWLMVFAIPLTGIYSLELTNYKMDKATISYFKLSLAVGLLLVCANLIFVVVAKLGAVGKFLAPFVVNLLVFLFLLIKHRGLLKIKTPFTDFVKIIKFCYPLALGAMLGYFTNGFDKTYLERLGDTESYGYYIVGSQIAGYLSVFSTAVYNTFQPDVYEAVANKNNKKLLATCTLEFLMISGIVLIFILLCPIVIDLLTAGRYVDSTVFARIISLSTITSTLYYLFNDVTIAKGFPKIYLYTSIFGSLIIVFLYPYITHIFSFKGGAYMVGASFLIFTILNIIFLLFAKSNHLKRLIS